MFRALTFAAALLASATLALPAWAADCGAAGPQSPRDITQWSGSNPANYGQPPERVDMNLCNIHLHENAEHKGPGFAVFAGDGPTGGYACGLRDTLSKAELRAPKVNHCGDLSPGDTIEVHWVFTSCDITPGPGLGSCSSKSCLNPTLRVEAQVFTLVNDPSAMQFETLDWDGFEVNGRPQPRSLPAHTGTPVEYFGSTTGPSYSDTSCSPLQVNWSVRPACAKLDIISLSRWCADNAFDENKPHGVRKLVTQPEQLSPIAHH